MTAPLVSVIVPTHNRASLLGRALRSALSQSIADLEVIVVDDASTDGTEAALRELADRRVRWIRRPTRGGPSAARNTGLAAARGEFVAFLDSDDEWLEHKLEVQLGALAAHRTAHVGLVTCDYEMITGTARRRGMPRLGCEAHRRLLELRSGPLTASVLLVPRAVVDAGVRFDEGFEALEDLDFAVQVTARYAAAVVPQVLVRKFRDNQREHAWTPAGRPLALERFIEKYRPELAARPAVLAHHHRRLALAYLERDRPDHARRHLGLAAAVAPGWWGEPLMRMAGRAGPQASRKALWVALTVERLEPATAVRRPIERLRDSLGRRAGRHLRSSGS